MTMKTLIFDIDHTLYPFSPEVEDWFSRSLSQAMVELMDISPEDAAQKREKYFREFGSTFSGLMFFDEINLSELAQKMSHVPLEAIPYSENAINKIRNLSGEKIAMTNATRAHGLRVLKHMDLLDDFSTVYGIDSVGYFGKPFPRSYNNLLKLHEINPHQAIFFEDTPKNLKYPKTLGMKTVLIGSHYTPSQSEENYIDFHFQNLDEAIDAIASI